MIGLGCFDVCVSYEYGVAGWLILMNVNVAYISAYRVDCACCWNARMRTEYSYIHLCRAPVITGSSRRRNRTTENNYARRRF